MRLPDDDLKEQRGIAAVLPAGITAEYLERLPRAFDGGVGRILLNTWVGFFLPSLATPFLIMYFRNSAFGKKAFARRGPYLSENEPTLCSYCGTSSKAS